MGDTPQGSSENRDWRTRTNSVGRRAILQAAGLSADEPEEDSDGEEEESEESEE